jgi:hypothetical protein
MDVCHVVTRWMCLGVCVEGHCLEGRVVHCRLDDSELRSTEGESGNKVGCQGVGHFYSPPHVYIM